MILAYANPSWDLERCKVKVVAEFPGGSLTN